MEFRYLDSNTVLGAILSIVIRCLLIAVSVLCLIVAKRVLLHPLRNIPGPPLAAVSNIWLAHHARNGRMLRLAKTLHRQYGAVVRVGPNEVWFDSKEAFSKIYGSASGYEKSNFYFALALHRPRLTKSLKVIFPDTLDLLGEVDMARYRMQRRLIGPLYQTHNLLKHEKAIDDVLSKTVSQLKSLNGAEVDLKEWMHIIVVECLSAIVLSWSPGFLRDGTDHGCASHAYLHWRRKSVFGLFPWVEIIGTYSRLLDRLFAKAWGLTFSPPANFKALFPVLAQRVSRRIKVAKSAAHAKHNREDLAADLIQLHKDRPEFTTDYLKRMIMTNFGAGHETTTSALTSAVSMLALHADVQTCILSEIQDAQPEQSSASAADEYKYTKAAVKEAQRLYPVIGMSLSRNVPVSGLHLHGHYFPPGTIVGCNPISLHRNADIVGPDPDIYDPQRWLQEPGRVRDMERYNLTYGGGARTCPGRNLAELIVFKVVPALARHFHIEMAYMPAEEDVCYYFMAMLTGVKVKFIARDSTPLKSGSELRSDERSENLV